LVALGDRCPDPFVRKSSYVVFHRVEAHRTHMRFVIVGPGAMGTVFAAALARRRHQVTMLGRSSAQLQTTRRHERRLQRLDGVIEQVALPVTDDPSVVRNADVVIVLVKAMDTATALARIRPYLGRGTILVTLQNGLGNAETIRGVVGNRTVLKGTTSQAATRIAPDLVAHTGVGPTLVGYETERDAAAAANLARAFSDAGLPAAPVSDIDRWIWQKLAINAAINGLTALGGFTNGVIAENEGLLDAAESVAEEVAAVARALGYELGGMRWAVRETAAATAANRSSMLQDVEAGRQTEVDAIHGAIVDAAARVGVAMPIVALLAALIRARTRSAAQEESRQ
jgi:2-dehydropantoate 2-reductase